MTEIALESDHPILFIYDVDNSDVSIPPYEDETLVAYNGSCVSVGMQANGPTTVRLADSAIDPVGALVFDGHLRAPSKSISVNTSEQEGWLTIGVATDSARVRVWANDDSEPSVITIEAA